MHRLAWEEAHGPIPDGMMVLHHCDNPPCYEVTHLYLGTAADNTRDMLNRSRAGKAKLTSAQVAEIRERYAAGGVTQGDLAVEYGISQPRISILIRNKRAND